MVKRHSMESQQLKQLESRLDALIQLCGQLNRENRALKAEASSWHHEREQLLHKTELARSKLEAMISRLRALEQES